MGERRSSSFALLDVLLLLGLGLVALLVLAQVISWVVGTILWIVRMATLLAIGLFIGLLVARRRRA